MIFTPDQRIAAFVSGNFALDTDSEQAQGLVGWWPLAVHGGKAKDFDYSLFNRHGTRTGGPTRKMVHHPRWGGVGVLDFPNDAYVDVGAVNGNAFSYLAWINVSSSATARTILGSSTANDGYQFRVDPDETLQLLKQNVLGLASSTGVITENIWQHVVVTHTVGKAVRFYLQGLDIGGGSHAETITESNVWIGARDNSGPVIEEITGSINDSRIYNRAQLAGMVWQIEQQPELIVYPLGVITRSFAPAAPGVTVGRGLLDGLKLARMRLVG